MLVTYDGIVISRRTVGESGVFIDILTDEQGIIEAAAHGANKINSNLLASSALFSYSTFCLSKSKLRYTVNSAKPKFSFHEIGQDIEKLALASYFAQAVKFCTPSEQPQDSIVRFFAIALYEIMNGRPLNSVKAAFELRYSAELGFAPNLVACDNCGSYECERGMYFLPNGARLICADCFNKDYGGEYELLDNDTLSAMRNIIFSQLDKCFKFNVSANSGKQLSRICEKHFLNSAERSFPALNYYRSLYL
ncbi:MAG: DNA repair protein RecO [Oscillospiraceae bacterium]|nr:DNA repair protein RecO [Oscillospiraceae bacterium]